MPGSGLSYDVNIGPKPGPRGVNKSSLSGQAEMQGSTADISH